MTDATRPGGDSNGANDPWAPPESKPSLEKNRDAAPGVPQQPASPAAGDVPPWQPPPSAQPPSVHDQATVVSMPAAGFPPPESAVPPPPIAPGGPAVPGGYGYPAYPQGGYGWVAPRCPAERHGHRGDGARHPGLLHVLRVRHRLAGARHPRRGLRHQGTPQGRARRGEQPRAGPGGLHHGHHRHRPRHRRDGPARRRIIAAINDDSEYDDPYYGAPRPAAVSVAPHRRTAERPDRASPGG